MGVDLANPSKTMNSQQWKQKPNIHAAYSLLLDTLWDQAALAFAQTNCALVKHGYREICYFT